MNNIEIVDIYIKDQQNGIVNSVLDSVVTSWNWDPKQAEIDALKGGLKGKVDAQQLAAAGDEPDKLRALYTNSKDIPHEADTLKAFMESQTGQTSSIIPANWKYSIYKAQSDYKDRWTNIPVVDWIMEGITPKPANPANP